MQIWKKFIQKNGKFFCYDCGKEMTVIDKFAICENCEVDEKHLQEKFEILQEFEK